MFKKMDLEYHGRALDPKASRVIAALAVIGLLFTLILIVLNHDARGEGLRGQVEANIDISGVTNPVTAVLLNFRAYDTLLEIGVLLIVVIAILPSRNDNAPLVQSIGNQHTDIVLVTLQRWIAPTLVVFAGYLLWAGAYKPGGAFQAGALLAGTCVLMFQTQRYRINYTSVIARYLLAAGLAMFVITGSLLAWFEGSLLTYPPGSAHILILLIETIATVSIAIALAALYSSLIEKPLSDMSSEGHK
ncbi:MnhB domain-containing protein [Teredinibacter franksiae]|jgi:Domain related to MnhB subunit of Na+/H+ antiporter.|uniref:MnhB domain-containing protein n=1 Tax=Teredinibacter franksiae TaxID=2761453 RepID=UPI001626D2F4|nr:MnhB domain-containing protein [Teredinibacter franksiae]